MKWIGYFAYFLVMAAVMFVVAMWFPQAIWAVLFVWALGILFPLSAMALNARADNRRMDALDKETSRLMAEGDYEGLADLIQRVEREGGYR